MKSWILVTGAAGFIGSQLIHFLLQKKTSVIGIDVFADTYNPEYKKKNLKPLLQDINFTFLKADITNPQELHKVFKKSSISQIVHLAALTGVRNSLLFPQKYKQVNETGTKILYEKAHEFNVKQFIFASSSSVYGSSSGISFSENQLLNPQSPYAQTKYEAEQILKKLYSRYQIPVVILRFFSVYGPHGRPDMAPYLFTEAAFHQKTILQFGDGNTARDYTYITDIVNAIYCTLNRKFNWEIINIGNSNPVKLKTLIALVHELTGKPLFIKKKPRQQSESALTFANIAKAQKLLGWKPTTEFPEGLRNFIKWYTDNRL